MKNPHLIAKGALQIAKVKIEDKRNGTFCLALEGSMR
jgi:hypothetical protein